MKVSKKTFRYCGPCRKTTKHTDEQYTSLCLNCGVIKAKIFNHKASQDHLK